MTDRIDVELVYAEPGQCWSLRLSLPSGARVGEALEAAAAGLAARGLELGGLGLAVFGRNATASTVLHDGDRIELLRPLVASPRESRALRADVARRRAARARSTRNAG